MTIKYAMGTGTHDRTVYAFPDRPARDRWVAAPSKGARGVVRGSSVAVIDALRDLHRDPNSLAVLYPVQAWSGHALGNPAAPEPPVGAMMVWACARCDYGEVWAYPVTAGQHTPSHECASDCNLEGLTFREWSDAASFGHGAPDSATRAAWKAAWFTGEDPTDYARTQS